VISGSSDTTLLVWDKDALKAEPPAAEATPLDAKALEALWTDLASDDARKEYRALWSLVALPKQAVPLLRERLKPVGAVDGKRLNDLIAELESNQFAVRQKATDELEKLGPMAKSALEKAQKGNASLEARRRVDELLERLKINSTPPAQTLQALRAVEVLEHIGNAEARQVLQLLAQGAPDAALTMDAKESLERLARRSASTP